jgi:dihydroorotase
MANLLIKNGSVYCYKNKINGERLDILISDGKIAKVGKNLNYECEVIDASGMFVFPGLIDMHVHLREPGFENKETIETGTKAAAKGGITTIVAMANTNPPISLPEVYIDVVERIKKKSVVNVLQSATITKNMEGKEITEMGLFKELGCITFSDDGKPVYDARIMQKALVYARNFDVLILEHPEDVSLSSGGVINEGVKSLELGVQGIPNSSESTAVARDILLAKESESRLHLQHISTKESVELIRWAKSMGINVTCEVTPHHLVLTEDDILGHLDTNKKMNPPLRTEEDRKSLIEALKDGIVDVIATDHAPHTKFEKSLTLQEAPFGTIGLETALPIVFTKLVKERILDFMELIKVFSFNPSKILGLSQKGHISEGADADIVIFDPGKKYVIDEEFFVSKGKNSCFLGFEVYGIVKYTVVGGRVVYTFS